MSTVRPDVRAFLEHYERAGRDLDGCELTHCFCEVFMSIDPKSATALSPETLLAALPRRRALFRAIGSDGLELTDVAEMPLDDAHTLVRTSWKLRTENDSPRDATTLRSTFLLRRENEAWRIAVYLNHQDMAKLLVDHGAKG